MQKDKINEEEIQPDLRHDTMEYSAATDGDDILDTDIQEEEDAISAEELDYLGKDKVDLQETALHSVELDRTTDNDVNFNVADKEVDYINDGPQVQPEQDPLAAE